MAREDFSAMRDFCKGNEGRIYSSTELKDALKHRIDKASVKPSDYCYNRAYKTTPFTMLIFEYVDGQYRFLGEDYPYSGKIFQKPKGKSEKVVGQWVDGKFELEDWNAFLNISRSHPKCSVTKLVGEKPTINLDESEETLPMNQVNVPLNQILYGPPGTGKTYHTVQAAVTAIDQKQPLQMPRDALKARYDELTDSQQIRFVTFHQSFGYEEFVQGLRATTDDAGQISYQVKDGVFKQICDAARADADQRYVLIIDEINRGNISKIFGELITLIETSKRTGTDAQPNLEALALQLPYSDSDELFTVPDNLYLIGTMNTADRSLAMMDTALRRRFDFKEMMPEPALLKGVVVKNIQLDQLLSTLNQRIEVLYDREHTLGHAFFMPVKEKLQSGTEQAAFEILCSVFQNKVIPLLEEYFFEDWQKIRLVLGDNQKRDPSQQFISAKKINDYRALFGSSYEQDNYAQEQYQYQVNSLTFANPAAYQGIYSKHVSEVADSKAVSEFAA
ncbi:McrB family protein [Pelagibaculum spongiae]|uniref:Uncharacterized protein n=1 Tax=Pelagibaculum spongiae TaxID=2080658 RepID=A0A2V1GW35_9GAMM|nr:AAA family ATPase [Pelagibaculum spongiae]PVZ64530.1 hypothetical protein DC094_19660 [Pelagibaculum spongiae]